jgi:hypothetical protein
MTFLENKVDGTGLIDITGLRDWARLGGGGYNAEGNAIYYEVKKKGPIPPFPTKRLQIINTFFRFSSQPQISQRNYNKTN